MQRSTLRAYSPWNGLSQSHWKESRVPRLSIVIPFRHDEERLETTLLSVLEASPDQTEIIVAHDGSYSDPFDLRDEVLFVQVDGKCSAVELINAGVMAACAPIVHILSDGVSVGSEWCLGAIDLMEQDRNLSAVAMAVQGPHGEPSFGISRKSVRDPSITNIERAHSTRGSDDVAPRLECGFFRRKVLLALGGFNERLGMMGAAIDFAWSMEALDLYAECDHDECVEASELTTRLNAAELETLSNLAVAYGRTTGGLGAAAKALLRGALGGQLRLALPWIRGILAKPKHSLAVRLAIAEEQLAPQPDVRQFPSGSETLRRAA